jgi:hypothetical protein
MFDMAYYDRMASECQTVLPERLIYLRSALAHASLVTCYRDAYTPFAIGHVPHYQRVAELNVKLYRDERAAGR